MNTVRRIQLSVVGLVVLTAGAYLVKTNAAQENQNLTQPDTSVQSKNAVHAKYILQGKNIDAVIQAVQSSGGTILKKLSIINAVAASLNQSQFNALQKNSAVQRITEDGTVKVNASTGGRKSSYTSLIGADELHAVGIDGQGITIAFLDSGFSVESNLTKNHPLLGLK